MTLRPNLDRPDITKYEADAANVCETCARLTWQRRFCSPECRDTRPEGIAKAALSVRVVQSRPQMSGVGIIGALDEWARWSA